MRTTVLFAAIATLAAAIGTSAVAADRDRNRSDEPRQITDVRTADGFDQGMQAVPNNAGPQDHAYGWRYFSDPKVHRAVVISPQGDYYLSQGKGLLWVVKKPA